MIGQFLNWIGDLFIRLFQRMFEFFSSLFGYLFQTLFNFLKKILQPIFILIAVVFYVLYKIGVLVVLLVKLFMAMGKMLIMFVKGIIVTLAGFSYSGGSMPGGSQWVSVFKNLSANGLSFFQLDVVAYIAMFSIWFFTALAAIRIFTTIRNQ